MDADYKASQAIQVMARLLGQIAIITMHLFKLIRGNRYRAYHEASPAFDIYECEKCGTKVNSVWLRKHPEQACPDDKENSSLRPVASPSLIVAKTQKGP